MSNLDLRRRAAQIARGGGHVEVEARHLKQLENRPKEKALAMETSKIIREQFDWYEVVKPMKHRIAEIYKKLKDQEK